MEKLLRIRKQDNQGATGQLWQKAKETQDQYLIKQVNKILTRRRECELEEKVKKRALKGFAHFGIKEVKVGKKVLKTKV